MEKAERKTDSDHFRVEKATGNFSFWDFIKGVFILPDRHGGMDQEIALGRLISGGEIRRWMLTY